MKAGDTIDRYTVVETLGEGGMATVFGVRHTTLGTPHALKVLTIEGGEIRDRLVQEGRVQARLKHPNIVAVTDVLDVDGSPGLLMQYVKGCALDEWLANYRPPLDEALIVFRGILAAVSHAHVEGVVHRDLKPANVMLAVDSKGAVTARVMDFGLAKSFAAKLREQKTRNGAVMGTPSYMPPEQIRDASTVDRRADIYALGCILYELVCGERAYEQADRVEMFEAIAEGRHQHIEERVEGLPVGVVEAIEGMMCFDRKYRLPDCAMVLEVLDSEEASLAAVTEITTRETAEGLAPPRPAKVIGPAKLPAASKGAEAVRFLARPPMQSVAMVSMPATTTSRKKRKSKAEPRPPPPSSGARWLTWVALFLITAIVATAAGTGIAALLIALLLAVA